LSRRSDNQPKISPPHNIAVFLRNILRFCLILLFLAGGYWLSSDKNAWERRSGTAIVYQQDIAELPVVAEDSLLAEADFSSAGGENEAAEEENVTVIDSARLDVDLIEQKFNPAAAEVARQAEASIVEVYPNGDGILTAPEVDQTPLLSLTESQEALSPSPSVSETEAVLPAKSGDDEVDTAEIEASYEEELPEEEYREPEENGKGYYVYRGHKKLRDMDIDVAHKPPYFGAEPVIAVVIDDMGISRSRTRDISSLQAPLTSSFLTYGTSLDAQVETARKSGHEIIVHVPMQPKSNIDVAPDVLTIEMTPAEITANFEKMLAKFSGIKGVNNHMGSLFTEHAEKLAPVMEVLHRRGLFFLDSKTSPKSAGRKVASEYAVPYAHRHVFLDNVNQVEYVNRQLALTEKIARRNGYAIAIGHPKSATYQALKQWLPSLPEKHIRILPLSEIVKVLNPTFSRTPDQGKNAG
jgi:hypothetical protein